MSDAGISRQAVRWLSRVSYGLNQKMIERFVGLGTSDAQRWSAFLKEQLQSGNFSDPDTESRIQALSLTTLQKGVGELWANHYLASRKKNMEKSADASVPMSAGQEKQSRKARRELALEPVLDLEMATWLRIVESPFQIFERMVEFWHDHFHVYGYEGRVAPGMVALNRDVIRVHALGNFRQLLAAVCRSPAMLFYLDNAFNQSGNPNENFARELFELHTLGAENYLGTLERERVGKDKQGRPLGYVDGDVYEAARAFTGWRVEDGTGGLSANSGQFFYFENWHDRFQKIVLGQSLPEHQAAMKDGDAVLDMLSSHPGTARFVARKLCRRFVSDYPATNLVEKVADTFLRQKDSPSQIRDVLMEILTSSEFLSDSTTKFKRPVDFFASILRSGSKRFDPSEKFIAGYQRAGQRLFGWRTPDGPPDFGIPWQSPQSLIERWRFAQQIVLGQIPGCEMEITNIKDLFTPAAMVGLLSRQLFVVPPADPLNSQLLKRAAGGRRMDVELPVNLVRERMSQIFELALMSPEFQLR
ncbi:MAG: DUF1800 domain-containing protein [Silvanigrellaceae bacterium]